ncbi:hypothetical protein RND61_14740 [Streptomyces sp. TRM76323]|uniref:Uncharacterized protein n=1 Tax=Streptomyces tamarix TaxID=3078565 RepID=A0ABU3QKL6_9ACTN|nr:hypothetical protein [Streptomyces tamarix]MDT9683320.1 hypothetical protein [Streptomyces tamarix]
MTYNVLELKIDGTIKEFINEQNNYRDSIMDFGLLNDKGQHTKLTNYDESSKATLTIPHITSVHLWIGYGYKAFIGFETANGYKFSIHAEGLTIHLVNSTYSKYDYRDGEYVSEMQTLVSYIDGRKTDSGYIQEEEKNKYNFYSQTQGLTHSQVKNTARSKLRRLFSRKG